MRNHCWHAPRVCWSFSCASSQEKEDKLVALLRITRTFMNIDCRRVKSRAAWQNGGVWLAVTGHWWQTVNLSKMLSPQSFLLSCFRTHSARKNNLTVLTKTLTVLIRTLTVLIRTLKVLIKTLTVLIRTLTFFIRILTWCTLNLFSSYHLTMQEPSFKQIGY